MTRWATCNVCEDGWDEDCTDPKWSHGVHIDHPVKPFSLCHGCYDAVIEHSWRLHARYARGALGRAPFGNPKETTDV